MLALLRHSFRKPLKALVFFFIIGLGRNWSQVNSKKDNNGVVDPLVSGIDLLFSPKPL